MARSTPKDIEMSVVPQHCCRFVYPTPYELHYSAYIRALYGENLAAASGLPPDTDPDLARPWRWTGSLARFCRYMLLHVMEDDV